MLDSQTVRVVILGKCIKLYKSLLHTIVMLKQMTARQPVSTCVLPRYRKVNITAGEVKILDRRTTASEITSLGLRPRALEGANDVFCRHILPEGWAREQITEGNVTVTHYYNSLRKRAFSYEVIEEEGGQTHRFVRASDEGTTGD